MKIIDAHAHIYQQLNGYGAKGELFPIGEGDGQWANGEITSLIPKEIGGKGFLIEQMLQLMDTNKVDKVMLLQGNLYGFQNIYVKKAMLKYPDRVLGACAVDPFARNGVETFEYLIEKEKFTAAKFEFSDNFGLMSFHHKFDLDCDMMKTYYQILEKNSAVLVVDIGTRGMNSYQPDAIRRVAEKFSSLQIVVCHLLAPKLGEKKLLEQDLARFVSHSNVYFDLSALPWNTKPDQYPFTTSLEYIQSAINIVGDDRLIWGSDAPGVILQTTYEQLISYILGTNLLSQSSKEKIFYKNANRVYFRNAR